MTQVDHRHLSLLMHYLGGTEHMQRISSMLNDFDGLDDAQRNTLIDEIAEQGATLRQSMLDLIVEDDTSEADIVLPFLWLEKRFEWMRLNSQMQYQTVFRGQADPVLMARGAALSDLIGVLESYLPPETAFFASKVAADPLGIARAELTRNERIFEALEAAGSGSRVAVDAIIGASETAARYSTDERVLGALEVASATVIEAMGRNLRITVDDFRLSLESEIAGLLSTSPLHLTLEMNGADSTAVFPAMVARGMRKIVRMWLGKLVQSTGGPADRISTGRKANLSLDLAVTVSPSEFTMQLTDDGDGETLFELTPPDRSLRDMHVSHDLVPGMGSTLTVRCGLRSVAGYLIVMAGEDEADATIAIPLDSIERMTSADSGDLAVHGLALQTAQEKDGLPIIDLGDCLYDTGVDPNTAVYVIVRCQGITGMRRIALRVRELRGLCRGSVSYVPEHCQTEFLRGFIMNRRRMVGVLDLERLAA
jgi:hypothetical protein